MGKIAHHFFVFFTATSLSLGANPPLRVGLVLDKGGRNDKSFNEAAYVGAKKARTKLGINLKAVESSDDSGYEPALRTFSQLGFDLMISIGFAQASAVKKVAADTPNKQFAIIDSLVDGPNVKSVLFEEHEGAFLVGVIAALTAKGNSVGFIGGMDIPLIRRFELGYRAGVKAAAPGKSVVTNYVGSGSDAWRNPTKAKELASSQYHSGAEVIFVAAGASNLGVFHAAEKAGKYAIGVDSNQDCVKPGFVLTSMLKRMDAAIFSLIQDRTQGKFETGKFRLGLKEGGVDFSVDECNRAILKPEVEKKANEFRRRIIAGEIKVPDYYITRSVAPY